MREVWETEALTGGWWARLGVFILHIVFKNYISCQYFRVGTVLIQFTFLASHEELGALAVAGSGVSTGTNACSWVPTASL